MGKRQRPSVDTLTDGPYTVGGVQVVMAQVGQARPRTEAEPARTRFGIPSEEDLKGLTSLPALVDSGAQINLVCDKVATAQAWDRVGAAPEAHSYGGEPL